MISFIRGENTNLTGGKSTWKHTWQNYEKSEPWLIFFSMVVFSHSVHVSFLQKLKTTQVDIFYRRYAK